jgi:hypothetical protein
MIDTAPEVAATHPWQTIIGDKNYYDRDFEHDLTERHLELLRPARKGEPERAGAHLFKPLRQVIESINQTFKTITDRLRQLNVPAPLGLSHLAAIAPRTNPFLRQIIKSLLSNRRFGNGPGC